MLVGVLVLAVAVSALAVRNPSSFTPCSAQGVHTLSLSPRHSGAVTTYALPEPLRSPNSISVSADRSIWFGEVGLRGVAHLYQNGTVMEYAWPSASGMSSDRCYDLSEIWGLVSWRGQVWASDSANNRLLGLDPITDRFQTISLMNGTLPGFIAVDPKGNLWFTESSVPARLGEVSGTTGSVSYYSVPAAHEFSASILFQNETHAYVTTVNPDNDLGHIFTFDLTSQAPTFVQMGGNETLLAPYSAAVADGGIWVSEHHASNIAFLDLTSNTLSFYPTSTDPRIPLSLPYYLQANGSQVWFNEHDADKIAVICCNKALLTEYNVSSASPAKAGIGNVLTIGVDKNLVWFTAWTGNEVGYVNASSPMGFSVSSNATKPLTIQRGSSATVELRVSGTSVRPLGISYSDSESYTSIPSQISLTPNRTSINGLDGSQLIKLKITASPSLRVGSYVLLATVTDGIVYRSVYVGLEII